MSRGGGVSRKEDLPFRPASVKFHQGRCEISAFDLRFSRALFLRSLAPRLTLLRAKDVRFCSPAGRSSAKGCGLFETASEWEKEAQRLLRIEQGGDEEKGREREGREEEKGEGEGKGGGKRRAGRGRGK